MAFHGLLFYWAAYVLIMLVLTDECFICINRFYSVIFYCLCNLSVVSRLACLQAI